ncbi:MAG: hypothetical protein Q4A78_02485 [Peptostreptococcaceae bacterium]|nr:hypothetical protein [Peptostreptococcaceae bacterium]
MVVATLQELTATVETDKESIREIAGASGELAELAGGLQEEVQKFRI